MNYLDEIIFFDINSEFPNECEQIMKEKINFLKKEVIMTYKSMDVRQFNESNVAFLSPANSFLLFDGGIDFYYGKMFPELQKDAQQMVKTYNKQTKRGYYLPVGSAMVVPVTYKNPQKDNTGDPVENIFIVAAPTMFQPMQIEETNHPFSCFIASLKAVEKYNKSLNDKSKCIKKLLVPGLGTGCGLISYEESARQIKKALTTFINHLGESDNLDEFPNDPNVYLTDQDEIVSDTNCIFN